MSSCSRCRGRLDCFQAVSCIAKIAAREHLEPVRNRCSPSLERLVSGSGAERNRRRSRAPRTKIGEALESYHATLFFLYFQGKTRTAYLSSTWGEKNAFLHHAGFESPLSNRHELAHLVLSGSCPQFRSCSPSVNRISTGELEKADRGKKDPTRRRRRGKLTDRTLLVFSSSSSDFSSSM